MGAGRKPKPAATIDNDVSHYSEEKKKDRLDNEPKFNTQNFVCPEDFVGLEREKWEELAELLRDMTNCPVSDADRDTMITYCKTWVSFINADREWSDNPKYYIQEYCGTDKFGCAKYILKVNENYLIRRDSMNLLVKLKSDLCLDVISRAKVGSARTNANQEKTMLETLRDWKDE